LTIKTDKKLKKTSNRDLLLPYGIPYFAYVGIASLSQDRIPVEIAYAMKIIIVPLLLYWAWKWYVPITGPEKPLGSVIYGIIFGIAGLVIWCALMAPFIDIKGEAWVDSDFFLRTFSAVLIVPVFEEFFIRGYILRAALQWDINRKTMKKTSALSETLDNNSIFDVKPGAWSVMAVAISSIAFTSGHLMVEWPSNSLQYLNISLVDYQKRSTLLHGGPLSDKFNPGYLCLLLWKLGLLVNPGT